MIEMVFYLLINLGRSDILTALSLPIGDQGISLHLFSPLVTFNSFLFHCTSLAHLLLDLPVSI